MGGIDEQSNGNSQRQKEVEEVYNSPYVSFILMFKTQNPFTRWEYPLYLNEGYIIYKFANMANQVKLYTLESFNFVGDNFHGL